MAKRKKARKLARLAKKGQLPFVCRECGDVFLTLDSRARHEKDAHDFPMHPEAQSRREAKRLRRQRARNQPLPHERPDQMPMFPSNSPEAREARRRAKEKDVIWVIDFVTPNTTVLCRAEGCNHAAIPLTGFCLEHDPVCLNISAGRLKLALKKAQEEETRKAPASPKPEDHEGAEPDAQPRFRIIPADNDGPRSDRLPSVDDGSWNGRHFEEGPYFH